MVNSVLRLALHLLLGSKVSDSNEGAGKGRVLVVDDSKTIRLLLSTYLRKSGFEVHEAEDGRAALRYLEMAETDVVLTDLQMPDLDGFGLLEAIKAKSAAAEVILVTSSSEQDVAVRALRLGAHDFLTKPLPGAEAVVLSVSRALEKKRLRETNARLMRELEALSRIDGLTGIANRRVFDESLREELSRAQRYGFPLSLAMIDIDHFKDVNDRYGHTAGDEVLRSVAQRLRNGIRDSDRIFRYGGEEFAVLLLHARLEAAVDVCGRLLERLREKPIECASGALRITASVGVACAHGEAVAPETLVQRADAALYEAKAGGRDRVVPSSESRSARGWATERKIS